MKVIAIIAALTSVVLAVAIPVELQERQCLVNGREYTYILTNLHSLTNAVPCDAYNPSTCCSLNCHGEEPPTL